MKWVAARAHAPHNSPRRHGRLLCGRGAAAVAEIRGLIRDRAMLRAAVGVSTNKFLAEGASELKKPDGLAVIDPAEAPVVLAPMSVAVLWGVGKVAAEKLVKVGVRTVADLLAADESLLNFHFGEEAIAHWKRLALGRDERHVHIDRANKSIGKERTFGDDIADP